MLTSEIRILATDKNIRGNLFTRLTSDLFFSLGYDGLRFNVHKSGREVDIEGEHRFEQRRLVAECKATASKIGGDDLNKFLGALTRERGKCSPKTIAGYFVSLSGFTETAVEQENESKPDSVILIDSQRIRDELERSRVLVTAAVAMERAGHCAQFSGLTDAVVDTVDLLGHERGYIWVVYYASAKQRTHFALVHADGTPLAAQIADEIVAADANCGGSLGKLHYLPPRGILADNSALRTSSISVYRRWVSEEYGFIHLDGLPADTDLSSTRLKLERLFVPLRAFVGAREKGTGKDDPGVPVGKLLLNLRHVAVLAPPGGGKSTLVKRLATAYASPERRAEVSDDLPAKDWLPIILRCRELRDRVHRPILEIVDDIPKHAGMSEDQGHAFRGLVHEAMRNGEALLLVDGLDEISDEAARRVFANLLRTFVAMFPQVTLVVTSREAGFRLVAGTVASVCTLAVISPLTQEDVVQLSEQWHIEVIGDNEKVRLDARRLAHEIWSDARIRALAENPLLLTTLFVVKRWIGELPRSRAALYREAIRVLVRTWNIEGYAPLDEDETLAQLSYIACAMLQNGTQQIGSGALLNLLEDARTELEAELQFARISPAEFVERIEYRSSLLTQTGHAKSGDAVEPVYEFRHLTFQEYLAARGYVEEQFPGRGSSECLNRLLEPHFRDETWQEVISLATVLAGRKADAVLKCLISACDEAKTRDRRVGADYRESALPIRLLYRCIRDEAQVTPSTLREALSRLANSRRRGIQRQPGWHDAILAGKFGDLFRQIVEHEYMSPSENFAEYIDAFSAISRQRNTDIRNAREMNSTFDALVSGMAGVDPLLRVKSALECEWLAEKHRFHLSIKAEVPVAVCKHFERAVGGLTQMVLSDDPQCAVAACSALAAIGLRRLLSQPLDSNCLLAIYQFWRSSGTTPYSTYPARAISAQQLLPRDSFETDVWGDCDTFLRHSVKKIPPTSGRLAALIVGWYRRKPWADAELARLLRGVVLRVPFSRHHSAICLLENLGDAGREVLEEHKARHMDFRNRRVVLRSDVI